MSTNLIPICYACAAKLREAGYTLTAAKLMPAVVKCGICKRPGLCEMMEVRKEWL